MSASTKPTFFSGGAGGGSVGARDHSGAPFARAAGLLGCGAMAILCLTAGLVVLYTAPPGSGVASRAGVLVMAFAFLALGAVGAAMAWEYSRHPAGRKALGS